MSKNKSMWNKGTAILLDEIGINGNLGRLLNELKLLCLNRFTWNNLPEGLESRHIENALFYNGQAMFFERKEGGYLCLPSSPSNNLNIYGDPLSFNCVGVTENFEVKVSDGVRILNNDNQTPNAPNIYYYAKLLNKIETTMHKNLHQQNYPYIIATNKNNELTMANLYKKIDNGDEVIVVDEKFSNGGDVGINVLQTNAPYLLDKLQQHKNDVINELLTKLGINNTNANNSKKERLLVDEVNVNNGHILMYLDIEYKNRLTACEKINEKFGLNITVEKTIENLSIDFLGKKNDIKKEGVENS